MKPILGKLFSHAVDDFSDPDVHDRAIYYYRLLSADVNTVRTSRNLLFPFFSREENF